MLTFKDFLNAEMKSLTEAPVAAKGDLDVQIIKTYITEFVISKNWEIKGTIKTKSNDIMCVYKHKQEDCYIVGEMSKRYENDEEIEEFAVYTRIQLRNEFINGVPYKSIIKVETRPILQGEGIATALYKFLVKNENIKLLSDSVQFFGARKLWARLSKSTVVDVIDSDSGEIIIKNVKLHQGRIDKDIDKRVWSYVDSLEQDYSKDYIRFILKDIK